MDDQSNTSHRAPRKFLKPRRLALLASVAGLSMAVLVIGPGDYRPLNLPAWIASARAAETAQAPQGFADLVAKVKPAVISVVINPGAMAFTVILRLAISWAMDLVSPISPAFEAA